MAPSICVSYTPSPALPYIQGSPRRVCLANKWLHSHHAYLRNPSALRRCPQHEPTTSLPRWKERTGVRSQGAGEWMGKLMGTLSEDLEGGDENSSQGVENLIAADLEGFLAEAGPRLCIVDFYTVWCGPCKIVDKNLKTMAAKCQNVRFGKYDCELPENEALASEMNIHELPTIILYRNGEEMKRFSGVASLGEVMGMAEIWDEKFASGELDPASTPT